MVNIFDLLNITGICPILSHAEPDQAVPVAHALLKAGLPIVEILMRDENSLDQLKTIACDVPEIIVGAGTVVTIEQANSVIDIGAQFVVLPGFSAKIVELCLKKNIPVIPGCVTPAEIQLAQEYSINVIKFFPVYEMGGVEILQQLSGPYPNVRYVVTGGLGSHNFVPLLEFKKVLAAGGDWMFTDGDALKNRDYDLIAANARHSHYKVLDMRAIRDAK
jgi:2-dehydro-3-deoxyphosphogluconate aldolase/(4S)-4-hydroxy-2-oxoglutarate aldolase